MILGLRTEADSVLSVIAPLGLAAAAPARPVLVIDLDSHGPAYPGDRTLAELVEAGPRRPELNPGANGMAVLGNGGIGSEAPALAAVETLTAGWPFIVLRVAGPIELPWPVLPLVPLLPGVLAPRGGRAAVWQATSFADQAPGPGPVLPPLRRSALVALLGVRTEPSGRWVRAWRRVWELPWE